MISTQLLEILACPLDKGELWDFQEDGFLYNPRLRRKYPIRDGICILMIDEAEVVDESEASELEAKHTDEARD
jgi:uncharacterized protein YbaR (Trm112 family)